MSDARALLEEYVSAGKALQLATVDETGAPVVCNLWFASAFGPDRLWFISRPNRAHCVNLRADERVAGAILAIELEDLGQPVRGVQFVGTARELAVTGIDDDIAAYVGRHPSAANAIAPARLASGESHHRVYRIDVTGWVLYDEVNFKGQPRQDVAVS
ncbi:pyridoxamine 5'-phosphate oxidase family protein [Phytomonospora sp. NPDC050363]|uniref:pyridoxamine 5'-phosphate oxidase family protein n=1 Tax=Phytomonospora sp. NPDC050363 TaxID=3155642 RepID=UPI0033D7980F